MSSIHAPSLPQHAQAAIATRTRRRSRRWLSALLVGSLALGVALLQTGVQPATAAGGDYLLMSRARLMSLPTSGTAWQSVVRIANGGWTAPELDDQDNKTNVQALAAALVYARTGDGAMRSKARGAIERMIPTYNLSEDAGLGPARQIAGWVLTADFIDLDGALDGQFRDLLRRALTSRIGTHSRWGGSLRICQEDSDNNWGGWCGASRIAAARYLGDGAELQQAERVYRGFLGDRSAWSHFRGQGSSNSVLSSAIRTWSCDASPDHYVPTNATCGDRSGAFPADAARTGSYSRLDAGYQSETTAGIVLQTELLYQAGYTGVWTNHGAVARIAAFDYQHGAWNLGSVQYHWPWLVNRRLGTKYPTVPAGYGRALGYTDWLYGGGGGSDGPTNPDPTPTPTRDATPAPTDATSDATPDPTKPGNGHHGAKATATPAPAVAATEGTSPLDGDTGTTTDSTTGEGGVQAQPGSAKGGGGGDADGKQASKRLKASATTAEAEPGQAAMYFALGSIAAGLLVLVLLQLRRRPASS
jgi:hypothetical protein